jgi:hypothetical protein
MNGIDLGGNRASSEVISELEFDSVYPEITLSAPSERAFDQFSSNYLQFI